MTPFFNQHPPKQNTFELLHAAIDTNQIKAVDDLLKALNTNEKEEMITLNGQWHEFLWKAIQSKQVEIVELLLKYGVLPQRNKQNQTPVEYLLAASKIELEPWDQKINFLKNELEPFKAVNQNYYEPNELPSIFGGPISKDELELAKRDLLQAELEVSEEESMKLVRQYSSLIALFQSDEKRQLSSSSQTNNSIKKVKY